MPCFEIIVQHHSGHAATGVRVVLGGTWGMSGSEYTDRYGKAVVSHSSTRPTVYVGGRDCGEVSPGRNVVTMR